jgi:hypothetical protein
MNLSFRTLPAALAVATVSAFALAAPAPAQEAGGRWSPKLDIPWNRYYDYTETLAWMDRIQETWPGFVKIEDIGSSYEGRPMRVMTLTDFSTGEASQKAAMWVDGNVHGNEVQGTEAALYMAWWLLEHKDDNERAAELLRKRAFYILPSQNPDGRDHWFHAANTASSSRTGTTPTDNDRDGLFDEDDYDDLDGDGEIVSMRKKVPMGQGTHRLDPDDDRILVPAGPGEDGDWLMLGREGIDNDGDGRVNEDGKGGYDMNRNWPSDWQPNHIQYGAGDYPFSYPETAAVGAFFVSHPNIAAVQSFHNSGGMLLRGPGDASVTYPRSDIRVYDELGAEGELILPFYRYMIIHADLYTVHGGFVNWTYEGLGIFSFTNELWARNQYWGGDFPQPDDYDWNERQLAWNDSVMMNEVYVDWHPVEHPLYGEIEVGGFKHQHGRVAPSFMIEEMLHRNAMFCIRHAEEIAEVSFAEPEVQGLGGGLYRVTVDLRNSNAMPSRSAMAGREGIGVPDRVTIEGGNLQAVAGGVLRDRFRPERMDPGDGRAPATVRLENGVPGKGRVTVSWLVRGSGDFTVRFTAEKTDDAEVAGTLGG